MAHAISSFVQRSTPQAGRSCVFQDKPVSTEHRPLGIPTVRDRVVQAALRLVMEPMFENDFHEHSYGFRRRRLSGIVSVGWLGFE